MNTFWCIFFIALAIWIQHIYTVFLSPFPHIPNTSSHFLPLSLSWTHPLSSDSCSLETHTHTYAQIKWMSLRVSLEPSWDKHYENTCLTLSAFSQLCRESGVWIWAFIQSALSLAPKTDVLTSHLPRSQLMELCNVSALLCLLSFTKLYSNNERKLFTVVARPKKQNDEWHNFHTL